MKKHTIGKLQDTLWWGSAMTAFGHCLIVGNSEEVCSLTFYDMPQELQSLLTTLAQTWRGCVLIENQSKALSYIDRIFNFQAADQMSLRLKGSSFQQKVWQALQRIPYGTTVSYEEVAHMVDQPKAVRAVAHAIGQNPIAFLIPCHRVIHKSGAYGKYRWRAHRKAQLIAYESYNK